MYIWKVKIFPSSKKNEIFYDSTVGWKIKITAPPIDGKANVFLIKFIAKEFKIPKSSINITKGLTSQFKIIEIKVNNFDNLLEQIKIKY